MGPVALTSVTAIGRRLPAWDSATALRTLSRQFQPDEDFDTFLERLVSDIDFRADIRRRMGVLGLRGPEVPAGTPNR